MPRTGRWSHVGFVTLFAALTAVWLTPVWTNATTAVPGAGAGDNLTFLWNLWWMRYSLHHAGLGFFRCPMILYPFGADLVLHTHTAFEAALAAVPWPAVSIVTAQNILIAFNLFLNFICAYALAWRLTRHSAAALAAALVFGWSPYLSAHLLGHFNLLVAWVLPLVVWLALRAVEERDIHSRIQFGAALALSAYLNYYYFVFAVALVALLLVCRCARCRSSGAWTRSVTIRPASTAVLVLLALALLLAGWIATTGGTDVVVAGRRVSLRGTQNPLSAAWFLLVIWAVVRIGSRVSVAIRSAELRDDVARLAIAASVAVVALAPILWHAAHLWAAGQYASQRYQWRSAPAGIDAATFLLGNPFGWLSGSAVQHLYGRWHIDVMEQGAWIDPAALILVLTALLACRRQRILAYPVSAAVLFFVWALGPRLVWFGHHSPVILPVVAIRYLPIVANARVPGRAMIVVYLAMAVLAAYGVRALWERGRLPRVAACLLLAILVADAWPLPPPIYRLPPTAVDEALARVAGGGAVCELPLGLRDGFGVIGRFDSTVLYHQTVYERPLVGGFVGRLPPAIATEYASLPIVAALLRLSGGGTFEAERGTFGRPDATALLQASGIKFVVIDRQLAPAALVRYVNATLTLRMIAADGRRTAYVLVP
ncbi:MAG TPA: hypothetical protein VFX12_13180 [Vicinamibacterales bacterium]|nr:hypothetical protein [Vicinamibacterales bacterium]